MRKTLLLFVMSTALVAVHGRPASPENAAAGPPAGAEASAAVAKESGLTGASVPSYRFLYGLFEVFGLKESGKPRVNAASLAVAARVSKDGFAASFAGKRFRIENLLGLSVRVDKLGTELEAAALDPKSDTVMAEGKVTLEGKAVEVSGFRFGFRLRFEDPYDLVWIALPPAPGGTDTPWDLKGPFNVEATVGELQGDTLTLTGARLVR
ncbi:MAG: hypothetical protein KA419_16545 [Acidobacteria bacterium]|nr:hypothetical protein [Acidobacteriota bacterium]